MLWLILWGACALATIVFGILELWKWAIVFAFITWLGTVLFRALSEGHH